MDVSKSYKKGVNKSVSIVEKSLGKKYSDEPVGKMKPRKNGEVKSKIYGDCKPC